MKTNDLKKVMIVSLLLTVFVFFGSAEEREKLPKFYYSNGGAKTLSESQTICVLDESGKYLKPRLKYNFTYDDNNRVVKKEALKWSEIKDDWVNSFCLTFIYNDDSMITEYSKWNVRSNKYDESTEMVVYKMNANLFTSYNYYKRNLRNEEWTLEKISPINTPVERLWTENSTLIVETNR